MQRKFTAAATRTLTPQMRSLWRSQLGTGGGVAVGLSTHKKMCKLKIHGGTVVRQQDERAPTVCYSELSTARTVVGGEKNTQHCCTKFQILPQGHI